MWLEHFCHGLVEQVNFQNGTCIDRFFIHKNGMGGYVYEKRHNAGRKKG